MTKARRDGEEDDFATAIWVASELLEEVMVARGDGGTMLGFGGGETVVMAALVVHGGTMKLLKILCVYGGCCVACGIGCKKRIGKWRDSLCGCWRRMVVQRDEYGGWLWRGGWWGMTLLQRLASPKKISHNITLLHQHFKCTPRYDS